MFHFDHYRLMFILFVLQIDDSMQSKTPSVNHEAEALKEELESINKKVDLLQESLQIKDDENSQLSERLYMFFFLHLIFILVYA